MKPMRISNPLSHIAWLTLLVIAPTGNAAEGPDPIPTPRTETLQDYTGLVSNLLPMFGPGMLNVQTGPDWMVGKSVHDVAQAAGDTDPQRIIADGQLRYGFDEPAGPRYIKLDFPRGYVRYSNRDRSSHEEGLCTAVSPGSAGAVFTSVLNALGLPAGERGSMAVDLVMDRSVHGPDNNPSPEETCEIERMVTQGRELPNGLPVFESWARSSVSNLGSCARVLIQWPRFVPASGLIMRTRNAVIDDLALRIYELEANSNGLGPEVVLNLKLGYEREPQGFVPVVRAAFSHVLDTNAGQVEYVPLAVNPNVGVPESPAAVARVQFRAFHDPTSGAEVLEFYLPSEEVVRLSLIDVSGRDVAVLADGEYPAGWSQLRWDLRNRTGQRVPSGVYFAKLQGRKTAAILKIVVVR